MTFNLFMAATDVYTGRLTPGDFVLIQALFLQLAGPLFNLGTLFRQIDKTSVDVEELFHMLKSKPFVKEKEDAVDFKYKEGKIKIENLGFKHYVFDDKTPANSKKEEKSKDKMKTNRKKTKKINQTIQNPKRYDAIGKCPKPILQKPFQFLQKKNKNCCLFGAVLQIGAGMSHD